jgi:hypothetical protein
MLARQRLRGHGRGEAVAYERVHVDRRFLGRALDRAVETGGSRDATHGVHAQQYQCAIDRADTAGEPIVGGVGDAQNAQAQAGLVAHHRSDLGGIDRRVAEQREYPWRPLCTAAEYAQRRGGLEYLGSRAVLIRVRARGHGVALFRVGQATGA